MLPAILYDAGWYSTTTAIELATPRGSGYLAQGDTCVQCLHYHHGVWKITINPIVVIVVIIIMIMIMIMIIMIIFTGTCREEAEPEPVVVREPDDRKLLRTKPTAGSQTDRQQLADGRQHTAHSTAHSSLTAHS